MSALALLLLSAAVVLGIVMVVRYADNARAWFRPLRLTHGTLAALGLASLIGALLIGKPAEDRFGVALFGPGAAILATLALLIGLWMGLRGRPTANGIGIVIGTHATLAVTAYVLLLTYVLLR
jgi:hypothetical protein